MSESEIACPNCGEKQSAENLRCARCGASTESTEERKKRLATVEQSRRETERDSVSIQRLPGFGTNGTRGDSFGTRQYFSSMSNQRRRRLAIVLVVFVIGVAFFWSQ
jgi:DNA-directed RNA polymerase subunit RPC12/RpoP